jgi:tetratricopeptide (TPR) repeat protein
MKSPILAAVLSLLAAGAASAQPSPSPVAPVTVQAPLTPREALTKSQSFVLSYAKPTVTLDQYARWEDPVCVAVSGVTPEQVALIKARVEEVALGVGLKLGRKGCKPNIDIRFADPPQALLDQVAKKSPGLLGFHYPNEINALKTVTRPIQGWYMTASRGEGAGEVALSTMSIGYLGLLDPNGTRAETSLTATTGLPEAMRPNESLDHPGGGVPNGCAGRRFTSCLQSVFWHVLVVVDAKRVNGQPLGPVMDYLAMLAISQPRTLDGCLELPSVIDLFAPAPCPGRPSPDGLTSGDSAYLTALYKADLEGKKTVEQGEIVDRMAKSLVNSSPALAKARLGAGVAVAEASDLLAAAQTDHAEAPAAAASDVQRDCFADQQAIMRAFSGNAARPELVAVIAGCTAFIAGRHSSGDIGLAYQARGGAHLKLGDNEEAVADYTAAMKPAAHNPRQTERILQDRGLGYQQLGRNDLAIADFNAALQLAPKNWQSVEITIALAMAYGRNQQPDQEIATYSALIKQDPQEIRGWLGRAYAEDAQGDFAAAEADARRTLDLQPDWPAAHKLMAEILIAEGHAKDAYADAAIAVKADPSDALALKFRADALLAGGERDKAIADYDRVVTLDPKLASAFNNRGAAYLSKGDYKAATDSFNTVIGLDPSESSAWLNRGLARQALGDNSGALTDFAQASTLDPKNAPAWRHRAFLEQRAGQYAQAADDYGRAIALNPKDEEALRGRGFAEIFLERYDAAITDLTAAIAIDPKDGVAYGFRATADAGAGKDAESQADRAKANQLTSAADGR